MQVFSKWRNQKRDAARKQQEEAQAERKRKGILSGREIFAQVRLKLQCCMPTDVALKVLAQFNFKLQLVLMYTRFCPVAFAV